MRGVTVGPVETPLSTGGYGTDKSAEVLDELVAMGVNWVALTPYGRMWDPRSTDILMDYEAPYEESRHRLRRMADQAHARGMRVMVVPHLYLDGGGFRVDIDPGSPARWALFLRNYRDFVVAWARDAAAAHVELFAIGQECHSFSGGRHRFWTDLIADVRRVYPGLVTYSANWWEESESVLFWDQLDLIGVNAFYPLAWDANSPHEHEVKAKEALSGLKELALTLQKPLFFTEIGFMSVRDTLYAPYAWPEHTEGDPTLDEAEQARGFEVMLRHFVPEPWFAGLFVWRYVADLDDITQEPGWGFSPHGKAAAQLLTQAFRSRWGADPARTRTGVNLGESGGQVH